MGAWIKLFEDGTQEIGTDHQVEEKTASWSRGRTIGIKEVQLASRTVLASLSVPITSWHQFDHFVVEVSFDQKPKSNRVLRVVQAKILEHHVGMFILKDWNGKYVFWVSVDPNNKTEAIEITDDMKGKWVTLVLPEHGFPYMNISEKGKFNGN